jgi:hypothetical protein
MKTSLDRVDRQFARHGFVHSVHFRPGDQAISHVRLVRDYRQQEARSLQPLQTGRGFGVKPEILQPLRGEAAADHGIPERRLPHPDQEIRQASARGTAYHFVCLRCKAGWLTRQCHTTAWKASDRGVTQFGLTAGIRTTTSPCLGSIAAISTYDPEHFRRTRLGEIDRLDDIRTDIALGIAAADGIDQDRVFLVELADFKPTRERRYPSPRRWYGR